MKAGVRMGVFCVQICFHSGQWFALFNFQLPRDLLHEQSLAQKTHFIVPSSELDIKFHYFHL